MPCAAPRILRRALAAPRSRSAMHAIDGVRGDEIVDGFAIARFRWAIAISAHPLDTGQALILIPEGNCGGRFAAPSAPIARRFADRAIRANHRDRGLGPVGWPRTERNRATAHGFPIVWCRSEHRCLASTIRAARGLARCRIAGRGVRDIDPKGPHAERPPVVSPALAYPLGAAFGLARLCRAEPVGPNGHFLRRIEGDAR